MNKNSLYGEFSDEVVKEPISHQPVPPQEIKIVEVKSNETNPFRWEVAAKILQGIVSNHEYSSAISRGLASKGTVDRETFKNEVVGISIGWADALIYQLEKTTIKQDKSNLS